MQTFDTPPVGLVPFDIEQHMPSVHAYVAASERAVYDVNTMLGNQMKKSDGIRIGFDLILVQSLLNPEKRSLFLSYGPTASGVELPVNDSQEIAGVVGDQLWFENDGRFFSATSELEARTAKLKQVLGPLGGVFKDMRKAIERMREQAKENKEGEEWKD